MLKANGHKVILWTSRAGRDLEAAVEWCHGQGLEFDAVNEPLPEQVARWGNDTRKVYADFYIDCNANIRRNVWRVAGSVKGAKRNPVARWGTKTTGLELNTHIITQDIEEIKRFFLYIGRKAAIMAIRIISAAAGAAILILAALGFFAYAVMAKAWNELFD